MTLANNVRQYYYDNIASLTDDKKFHFATRMAAWNGDTAAFELLRSPEPIIKPADVPLDTVIKDICLKPQTGRRNAHELRQPYFEKFSDLYGAHLALFRVRHLQSVYGVDARGALTNTLPLTTLIQLRNDLLQDTQAFKILSTFAINYPYLLEHVIRREYNSIDVEALYQVGQTYDLSDTTELQLMIYFYTHCIIGESHFYTRTLPEQHMPVYQKMLKHLEAVISTNFARINLDNKLEFLVCAQICNYESSLRARVYDECEDSVSSDGMFIIDKHNANIQSDRNDFIKSEHRNVLFIMSSTPYTPHSTLVV